VDTKECRRCMAVKPVSEFHRSSRLEDGYQTWCHDCINGYKVEWRTKRDTPEELSVRIRTQENRELVKVGKKKCATCELIYNLNEFPKGEGTGDRRSACIYCNVMRSRAMDAIRHAVDSGQIERPDTCPICGRLPVSCRATTHFHHTNGYEGHNVYVGRFVCARCHMDIHNGHIKVEGYDHLPER
jgi:hypothetical protein